MTMIAVVWPLGHVPAPGPTSPSSPVGSTCLSPCVVALAASSTTPTTAASRARPRASATPTIPSARNAKPSGSTIPDTASAARSTRGRSSPAKPTSVRSSSDSPHAVRVAIAHTTRPAAAHRAATSSGGRERRMGFRLPAAAGDLARPSVQIRSVVGNDGPPAWAHPGGAVPRPVRRDASAGATEPQADLLHLGSRRHALPAARRQRVDAVAVAEDDPGAAAVGRRPERGLAQRPGPVLLREAVDGAAHLLVPHPAAEQLADDRGFGDVLDAVHARVALRAGRADVAAPRPLADRGARDARELADLGGEEVAVWPRGPVTTHAEGMPRRPA